MPARRCKDCAADWPATSEFFKCPSCDGTTRFSSKVEPDEDWQERLELLRDAPRFDDKVDANRYRRFVDAGLDEERAVVWAIAKECDVHLFEKLIEKGASINLAARITAPLG